MACINPAVPSCPISAEEDYGSQTLKKIAKQLRLYKPPTVAEGDYQNDGVNIDATSAGCEQFSRAAWHERRAAVLVCLFEGHQGELRVILTKRSMKLSSYPGDVALPGGKMDEGDVDDSAIALRETVEEIGLEPKLVQVVANLEPFICLQHHLLLKVIPVIGLLHRIEEFKPVLNNDEVDAMFDVPLEMFLKRENHKFDEREWMDLKYVVHNFEFDSHNDDQQEVFLIRGLTASILVKTASIIYQKPPCFQQHHLPDFQELQTSLCDFS